MASNVLSTKYTIEDRGYSSPCWIWKGYTKADGYGRWRGTTAHRAMYVELVGPVGEWDTVDHLCRVRSCVNPDHLQAVTPAVNAQRGNQSKLTWHDVWAIRASSEKQHVLAERYGVTQGHIANILGGRSGGERLSENLVRTDYRTIVADPPWPFEWQGGSGGRRANSTKLGYETMNYQSIAELGFGLVPGLVADDATLLLWVTQDAVHGGWAERVAKAWGFVTRVGEFIWRKPNFGSGAFPRIGHETCVIYRRGSGSLKADAPRDVHSVQTWAQRYASNGGKTHSAKPDGFYDVVEQGFVGPYLELFARRARFGWDYWGDQSLGTVETAA